MPKIVDRDERRDDVLDATWQVVATEGIAAATVRRIAEEVGCTTGLLTHHFANKDDILIAALSRAHMAAGKRVRCHLAATSRLAALRAVLLEVLPLDEERRIEWRVWMAFWGQAPGNPKMISEIHNRYSEWRSVLSGLLKEAQQAGEITHAIDITEKTDHAISLSDVSALETG